jgi:hypothetical protein
MRAVEHRQISSNDAGKLQYTPDFKFSLALTAPNACCELAHIGSRHQNVCTKYLHNNHSEAA